METLLGFIKKQEVAPVAFKKSSNLVTNKTFKDSLHFLSLRDTFFMTFPSHGALSKSFTEMPLNLGVTGRSFKRMKETVLKSVAKCSSKQFPEEKVTRIFPSRVVSPFQSTYHACFLPFSLQNEGAESGTGIVSYSKLAFKGVVPGSFAILNNQHY